jgi:hypothetical protein
MTDMTEDERHEALGAMLHRGKVEAAQRPTIEVTAAMVAAGRAALLRKYDAAPDQHAACAEAVYRAMEKAR